MKPLLLAIDQGTTGTKVLIMDSDLQVLAEKSTPFEQHFPVPGQVEHDLDQIWASVQEGIDAVTSKVDASQIAAIGITNQRETICFWERETLRPVRRAIVWQDRRTSARCAELKSIGLESKIQEKTGLLLDPYFSSTKLEWALKNDPAVMSAQKAGTLAVGTVETFILARLTAGASHATESSNASRTMLYSLERGDWDPELLGLFGVDARILPEVRNTFGEFGKTRGVRNLPDGIPVSGMIGDQQSALLGQACFEAGSAKCTYGTGAFLLMNTGNEMRKSTSRLLTTVAWRDRDGKTCFALEGSAFMAGATIQWLRDGLQILKSASEVEALAASVPSSEGVMLVPAFTGLGAPYWDPEARAVISGLTRGSTRAHIARAALEGIAFQNVDILNAMERDLGREIGDLCVDGGACRNSLLMQIQSDLLGRRLLRPELTETTAIGAIFAAGLGVGIWSGFSELEKVWRLDREFTPSISMEERSRRLQHWSKAVERARIV
jgi:glycerol kinase